MNIFQLFVPVWRRLALNSLVSGEYGKAEKYFLRIQRYSLHERGIEYNLGLIKLAMNKFEEAESLFKKDMALYGETYTRTRVMGDLNYIWGRREQAAGWYRKALADCENETDRNLLRMRIQKCSSEKAFEKVRKSHLFYTEGNNLLQHGNDEGALRAFSDAVEQDNTHFQALNNKGSVLMNSFQRYAEALACFEQALRINPLPSIERNKIKAGEALKKEKNVKH